MAFVTSIKNERVLSYIDRTSIGNHIEIPSLIDAQAQEHILTKMSNQNYHFDLYVSYDNSFLNSPVYHLTLVFDDDLTETEYRLVR